MKAVLVLSVLVFYFSSLGCGFAQDLKTVRAEGIGMSPTIEDGDNLVIDRRAYEKVAEVARFDVIAFRVSSDLFHYKRVIGLPNEKIEIKDGEVLIDDKVLNEPFAKENGSESNFGPLVIPEGEYFVLGDNRPNSADSRIWEPPTIKRKTILGRIVEIVRAKK